MVSKVIIGGGIFALILLIIQTVAVATPNWFNLTISGEITLGIGLFAVCVPDKECVSYGKYMFKEDGPSFSYIAFVGLHLLGCFFCFLSLIICITHTASPKSNPERSSIKRTSAMWFFSGGFILAGVIWIYTSLARIDSLEAVSSMSVDPGYSFYLSCLTGALHIIAAIILTVIASRLPTLPTCVVSTGTPPPQMLVMQADASGYPTADAAGFTNVDNMGHTKDTSTGYPTSASYGLPQHHPSYGYNQP